MRQSSRLDSLTGLRFFAAFFVVAFHTLRGTTGNGPWDIPGTHLLATAGFVGVTLFFVLSGFVLTWSWEPQLKHRHFYGRRFARIFPLYAAAWLFAFLVDVHFHHTPHAGPAIASFFLVQSWLWTPAFVFAVSPVFWTLSCELFFYLIFPVILPRISRLSPRGLIGLGGACLVWLLGGALLAAAGSGTTAASVSVLPIYRVAEFILGIVIALAVKQGWKPPVRVIPAALLVLGSYLIGGKLVTHFDRHHSLAGHQFAANLVVVVPVALLMVVLANADLAGTRTLLSTSALVKLGQWSFALYLVHRTLVACLVGRFGGGSSTSAEVFRWLVVVVLCIVAAGIAHELLERPIEKWLRPRIGASRARVEEP